MARRRQLPHDEALIPVIDAPDGPLQLAGIRRDDLPHIVSLTQQIIPRPLLRLGDAYARRCLRTSKNPYLHEIEQVARWLDQPGAYALNFSFEMGCTTACHVPGGGRGARLYHTLDWPFRLGRDVVVACHAAPAGRYCNVTWPGYLGVLTGLAPGRFAAAINQPPMRYSFGSISLGVAVDWVVNRWRVRRAAALPPTHLLRQAFEQCPTYAEAKAMLATTPLCIPVIYALTGATPNEGCIIERQEHAAVVHDAPACITNHWLHDGFKGRPRGRNSARRLAAMRAALPSLGGTQFSWLRPPVLNALTRVAAELDAGNGCLAVQGWHGFSPMTRILTHAWTHPWEAEPQRTQASGSG
jgi:hypothetical protein